jgi:UDP-N-acetylmuramoyl-L-alanyl-D-glutamate--2,6-diaminopimelate ligase
MDGDRVFISATSWDERSITGLTSDSREVKPGYLFAALAGSRTDGARFIADAVAKGAAAILVGDPAGVGDLPVPVIADQNPRRRLARMAARFHAPQPGVIAAVTGTNGKTSVAVFTRQLWERAGLAAASLGTIGLVAPAKNRPGSLTTPDPVALHRTLKELAEAGIDHVALEASSHGLDQSRLDGLALRTACFTNLTRDHLDYHGNMAAYFAAKRRLFTELLPADGTAVINLDSDAGKELAATSLARGLRVIRFGAVSNADIRLVDARPTPNGQDIVVEAAGIRRSLHLPLLGAFQAMNALAAVGLAAATGVDLAAALDGLPSLMGVPGRMEQAAALPNGAPVIVDYAHTPDALATVLAALRPHCRGRLIVVFGCGGDRDPGKRPMMGEIAARGADLAIVTDDNPRTEDAAAIRGAILAACPGAREIGDRRCAIAEAVALLAAGDVLLIAGKGHETGQIVGNTVLPFNDADVARLTVGALTERKP